MNRWHSLPAEVYALVERTPATVLLESSAPRGDRSNGAECSSRLFTAPLRVIAAREPAELTNLFAQIESAIADGHVAAGFFAYECGESFEPKAAKRPIDKSAQRGSDQPLAWFGIYERSYCFDHRTGAFADSDPPGLAGPGSRWAGEANEIEAPWELTPGLTEQPYRDRIEAIHEWIRAGDIYQLNFTFPLRARIAVSPAALYARLHGRQPAEYGAFLHCQPGRHTLCFSPELFFRLEDQSGTRRITAQPMKGTARRGRTTVEDRQIAEWLSHDPKNRSENVMIVDLIRNDLGRLCAFGSVRVESLFAVERLQTLWQMTSTVRGELRRDVGFEQIFRALFPCGSVTGAPKIRAMQLLAQIEEEPRGIYTGAIGYFSRGQSVFNVAIRTLELEGNDAKMGVGSGIVIDSNPADEFRECLLKAEFAARSHESFSLVETMLWNGGYPLLDLHLDRLTDSADYFGFTCDRAEIQAALLAAAVGFRGAAPRKVRLLLDSKGRAHIEHEIIPPEAADAQPARVCMATERTDSRDRMLFHKTTHRALYQSALKAAQAAGFADVLFLNERGEVTEGAISNVFLQQAGRWCTPPVECGLLPGVYRRHLLATRPEIEERVLHAEDLQSADPVYLANAVRGLRRVLVHWS